MGTGKSSVGRIVANRLHFHFVDTDHLIENQTGKSIAQIFSEEGEASFRLKEEEATKDLEKVVDTVVAIGGGLILNPANVESLRKHALLVCLWASPNSVYARIRSQAHRPLLQTGDPKKTIGELLQHRAPIYRRVADVLMNTEYRSVPEVARHVAHQFLSARMKDQGVS